MPAISASAVLLSILDEAFDRRSWHGTTLYGSLRGLDPATASARPRPGRRNIWEIVVHCAYWKYTVRRRLTGEKRGTFALDGSNWFARPPVRRLRTSGRAAAVADTARPLRSDVELLVREHRALRHAVAALSDRDLERRLGRGTVAWTIRGIAAHDLYHAGQIQLIKKLVAGRRT